jgi:hypothetical protein
MAMSKYQRATLQARKIAGPPALTPSPPAIPPRDASPAQNPYASAPPPNPYTSPPTNSFSPHNETPEIEDTSIIPPPGPPPRLAMPTQRSEKPENPFDDTDRALPQGGINGTSASPPALPNEGSQSSAYHPGYRPTPSYLNRQESSAANLTMHAAGGEEEDGAESPEEMRKVQYRF